MICRICHEDESENALIAPCACSGSIKYAHRACMLQWVQISNRTECEICTSKIAVIALGTSLKQMLQRGNYLVFVWIIHSLATSLIAFFLWVIIFTLIRQSLLTDYRMTPLFILISFQLSNGFMVASILYGSCYFFAVCKQSSIRLLYDLE